MNRSLASPLVALAVLASACGSSTAEVEASTSALLTVVADDAGSIIFYESLADQVLDSDAVVSGRIVRVEAAREEQDLGGSDEPLRWVHVVLKVTAVIHSSDQVKVEPGQLLRIEMPQPELMSIDDANRAIPANNEGLHFLFNSASLLSRLGEPLPPNAESIWIYQNGRSIVINDNGRAAGGGEGIPGSQVADYTSFVEATVAAAERVNNLDRPETPIGLTDNSNLTDTDVGQTEAEG